MALTREDMSATKIVSGGRKASGGAQEPSGGRVEAAIGIEPMCGGFADLCLTAWLRRQPDHQIGSVARNSTGGFGTLSIRRVKRSGPAPRGEPARILERETGVEPATSTLARLHSTTELFPRTPGSPGRDADLSGRFRRLSRH